MMFNYATLFWTLFKILAILTLYGCLLVIYRLTLHPLARFPGPKIAAATKWYEFYFDIFHGQGGTYMHEINRMHDEYGPIVRICPNELHVRDSKWYPTLNAGSGKMRDKYKPAARMAGINTATFSTIHHREHRMRRIPLAPYFSKSYIAMAESTFLEKADKLCAALRKQLETNPEGSISLHPNFLAFTIDSVCAYAFDYSLNLLEKPQKAEDWAKTLSSVAELTPLVKQFTWLIPLGKMLPRRLIRFVHADIARLLDLMDEMNKYAFHATAKFGELSDVEKLQPGNNKKTKKPSSVVEDLLLSDLPESEKHYTRIGDECTAIIAAAGETTARTLTNAMFHILNNQQVHKILKDELKTVMPDPNVLPPAKELEKLPYLNAVVKEAIRQWGAISSRQPLIAPVEDLVYRDWIIPSGTVVGMTVRDVLHDPIIYPCPSLFKPERWSRNDPESIMCDRHFVGFGRGNRMCLGMNLAYTEMYYALAAVVGRFDFELYDTIQERDVDVSRDCFLSMPRKESLGVKVRLLGER